MKEDFDRKNQVRINSLPNPIIIREPASELYVAKNYNDPS